MKEHLFCFNAEDRLKKRTEIQMVFKKGTPAACFGAKLFVLQNDLKHNRIGFTLSRNFGNAVKRNHAKRLGREAYRHIGYTLKSGHDMVLLVYPTEKKDTFKNRMKQLKSLCSVASLWK